MRLRQITNNETARQFDVRRYKHIFKNLIYMHCHVPVSTTVLVLVLQREFPGTF